MASSQMSEEGSQRAMVVAEARKWLKTPYHPMGDIKGAGVDCGMLLVRVFVDTGLCAPFDPRPYASDWMLHRSEEKYLGFVFDRTAEVSVPGLGDVMVFKFARCYSHGGIVTSVSPLRIVHAFMAAKAVIEEGIEGNAALTHPARKPRFFSYWAKK